MKNDEWVKLVIIVSWFNLELADYVMCKLLEDFRCDVNEKMKAK